MQKITDAQLLSGALSNLSIEEEAKLLVPKTQRLIDDLSDLVENGTPNPTKWVAMLQDSGIQVFKGEKGVLIPSQSINPKPQDRKTAKKIVRHFKGFKGSGGERVILVTEPDYFKKRLELAKSLLTNLKKEGL